MHGFLEISSAHPTQYFVRREKAASIIERRQLTAVAERLKAELAPCSNLALIDIVVTRVLLGFEHGRGRCDEESDVLVKEYIAALKPYPLAAIHAAAERFRGTTLLPWSRRFRPSPAEFAAEVSEGMIPLRTRLIQVRRVLGAEVYDVPTESERAEVARAAEAHLRRASRGDGPGQHRRETPAEISAAQEAQLQDSLARLRKAGRGPSIGRLMAHLDARRGGQPGVALT